MAALGAVSVLSKSVCGRSAMGNRSLTMTPALVKPYPAVLSRGQTLSTYRVQVLGNDKSQCSLEIAYELQDPSMSGCPAEIELRQKLGAGLGEILEAMKLRVETGQQVREHKIS